MKFSMTCACGDTMTVDAANRDEAAGKMKVMMNEEGIKKHMAEKHTGEPLISVSDCHAMIDQKLVEVK